MDCQYENFCPYECSNDLQSCGHNDEFRRNIGSIKESPSRRQQRQFPADSLRAQYRVVFA